MLPPRAVPVLLATSNGSGMGHLTRQLAIALAGSGVIDATLFSMSPALPWATGLGVRGEYCPGIDRNWIPRHLWHRYVRDRIVAIVNETGARAVVFDGVSPYAGVGWARSRLRHIPFVWMRRGMWQHAVNDRALAAGAWFDLIVEPGDLGAAGDRGPTAHRGDAEIVEPVTLLDVVERPERRQAAAALGIDPNRPTALVMLSNGRSSAGPSPEEVTVSTLLEDGAWQVCVVRPPAGHAPPPDRGRVSVLSGVYPLVRHLAAFDVAVSSAGYNTVHELIPAEIPTLLIPKATTRTDDQARRARTLEKEGLALVADGADPWLVAEGVRRLLDPRSRRVITSACRDLPHSRRGGGAVRVAHRIADLAGRHHPARATFADLRRSTDAILRQVSGGVVGESGVARMRRALGRPSQPAGIAGRLAVTLDSGVGARQPGSLLLTFGASATAVAGDGPVEDILPGAGPAYVAERRRIMRAGFDVVD